ncbi:reverse transcriptase domain-containing protein [Tanacetum coccineum]
MSPWLFYKLGIDIAGPFPEGPGKVKFFNCCPLNTITNGLSKAYRCYHWKSSIISTYGITSSTDSRNLGIFVSDNGKQFCENPFKDWREKLSIRQRFASVKHPQTNGLVERGNKSLGEGIKARLDERSKDWMGELSYVLWAHRTMIKSSNGETPFSLTYGTEAVILAEIGMPTLRTVEIDLIKNDEALEINLDLIEEKREQTAIQEAKAKLKWKVILTLKSAATDSNQGHRVYVTMMQVTPKTEVNLGLNGKDHIRSQNH